MRRQAYRQIDRRGTVGLPVAAGRAVRVLAPLVLLSLCGCAGFWDEVTSRNFKFKSLFVKTDPVVVLRESGDGDERAKAIRRIQEPKEHGGTDEQQRVVVELLLKSATLDRQPLCRLAAIEKLGHFKDPRAFQGLKDAFFNAGDLPPEIALRVQCQAIVSIGETGNPAAVKFLTDVLKEPPAERSDLAQQRSDRCIAAARALADYKDAQATAALAQALQKEKNDVALRNSVHESLIAETGKKLPPDPEAWNQYLNGGSQDEGTDKKIVPARWIRP